MTRAPLLLPSDRNAESVPPPSGCAPRRDYRELARVLGHAPLLFPPTGGALSAKLERRAATDLRQAVEAARRFRSVSVYVSFSEKVGLPLALLLAARRIPTAHVLIAHHLTSARKRALQARIGWLRYFTRIVVVAEPQAAYLRDTAGYPVERIALLPDSVDLEFWNTAPSAAFADPNDPFVLSVGRERRDYRTLAAAAREMAPVRFVTVASSLWGRPLPTLRPAGPALTPFPSPISGGGVPVAGSVSASRQAADDSVAGTPPPEMGEGKGVRAGPAGRREGESLSSPELRALYARAAVVALPLEAGTRYAAGANALLEAMAMGKPAVVARTPGLAWYAADGETARVVPPGDPAALAAAIRDLLTDPVEAARLGANARCAAEAWHGLEGYVAALARVVREAEAEGVSAAAR